MSQRILIVDDDRDIARFVELNLSLEGFEVEVVHDGEAALRSATANPPDLIMLDVMMPVMDGVEVLRRLRAHEVTADVPIVILTAKSLSADKLIGLTAGANDYIVKPFDTLEVVARVRSALRWSVRPRGSVGDDESVIELPGFVDAMGQPLSVSHPAARSMIVAVKSVIADLVDRIVDQPEAMHRLSPREFEELVATLLDRQGFTVALTRGSRDDGIDIYAARNSALGTFQYLVQCKKYSPANPVGVEVVRQMHGVLTANRATAGIVATTSRFTRGAREYQSQVPFQLSLRDYNAITRWLAAVPPA
jgi:DNA-binding response OmpR family regulator